MTSPSRLALQHSCPPGVALGWLCDLSWCPSPSQVSQSLSPSSRLPAWHHCPSSPPACPLTFPKAPFPPSPGWPRAQPTGRSKRKYFLSLAAAPSPKKYLRLSELWTNHYATSLRQIYKCRCKSMTNRLLPFSSRLHPFTSSLYPYLLDFP